MCQEPLGFTHVSLTFPDEMHGCRHSLMTCSLLLSIASEYPV